MRLGRDRHRLEFAVAHDCPEKPFDPEAAAAIARVRKLMLIASVTTLIAVGAVLAVIGYRVSHLQGSGAAPAAAGAAVSVRGLPAGTKVLSSAVGDGRIVLTVEVDGAIELRSFDLDTLKPLGRARLGAYAGGQVSRACAACGTQAISRLLAQAPFV